VAQAAVPRDSATVLLLRDGAEGLEVFMVRRHGRSAFMADAHVFPGGTTYAQDASEALRARASGRSPEEAARVLGERDPMRAFGLHCAAIRETFEEAGVLLADVPDDGGALTDARQRLLEGTPFASVLETLDARLALDRLIPHTRWITPEVEPRRYDARFFLALAPADQTAEHDRLETTAGLWTRPETALADEREGRIRLAPPTMRTLEALVPFSTAHTALEGAAQTPPPTVAPVLRQVGDQLVLCLPGDPDHPVSERALPGSTRMVLMDGRWWSR
jgi:8-oxo-dGTP pyrophosphatase MutT (NUDIX family)